MTQNSTPDRPYKPIFEIGAPAYHHCCGAYCDYDPRHDDLALACWTLTNPSDGGDPLYYCDDCRNEMENNK